MYKKYGGFLGFILIVELAIATSMYAYKDRLADGFDKGLNDSMEKYGPEDVERTNDFDKMQIKVFEFLVNILKLQLTEIFFF